MTLLTRYGMPCAHRASLAGDMMDVATSPNDPLFVFHHSNVDRMNLAWVANLKEASAQQQQQQQQHHPAEGEQAEQEQQPVEWDEDEEDYYGFPANYSRWLSAAEADPFYADLAPASLWRSSKAGCGASQLVTPLFSRDSSL